LDDDFCFKPISGAIGGTVFLDEDDSGVQDAGEPGIEGVTVNLVCSGIPPLSDSQFTDANGNYLFTGILDGFECEVRTVPSTAPDDVEPGVCPTKFQHRFAAGESFLDDDFCFTSIPAEISGMKYEDINGNGVKDDGITGIEGWQIDLDCEDGTQGTTNTDSDGNYLFDDIPVPNECTVTEEDRTGWDNTTPDSVLFDDLQSGDKETADFGNFELGKIHALKYNDLDGDGIFNNDDEEIEGWEMCLFLASDDPEADPAIECQDTDVDGLVWFEDLFIDDYQVCEEDQTEWVHTTDPCVPAAIIVSSDEVEVEFGNLRPIEAEKTWTHTDYNWDPICDADFDGVPDDPCESEDRLRETDRPLDDVLADTLPKPGDKYIVDAVVNKNKLLNTIPGAFYALTTIEINADLDSLIVDEIYGDCYEDKELVKFVSKRNTFTNIKVAVANSDGDVTEISDDIYDGVGGQINEINKTHAEVEINDSDLLTEGSTVYVLVKFQHDLKGERAPGNNFMAMCNNSEEVTANLLDQDAEVIAEAALKITT